MVLNATPHDFCFLSQEGVSDGDFLRLLPCGGYWGSQPSRYIGIFHKPPLERNEIAYACQGGVLCPSKASEYPRDKPFNMIIGLLGIPWGTKRNRIFRQTVQQIVPV